MPVTLRPGVPADWTFVEDLSEVVFSRFGPYNLILPPLLEDYDVETVVAQADALAIGFAMVRPGATSELVAIAVEPDWHRRGAGRLLLARAEELALRAAGPSGCPLRLSVASDNTEARRMFEQSGYVALPPGTGRYPGGQVSIDMVKQLT